MEISKMPITIIIPFISYRLPAAYSPIQISNTSLGGWIRASSYWHFH